MSASLSTALLDHLWESSLFALAACLLIIAFRKGSTWSRHFIAWAAYAKFLLPLALLSFSFPKSFVEDNAGQALLLKEAPPLQALSASLDLEYWLAKMTAPAEAAKDASIEFPWVLSVFVLWASIAVTLFARRWIQYLRCKRNIVKLSLPADEIWVELARKIAGKRTLPKLVIGQGNHLNAGVFGLWSCTVVIPNKLDTVFDADDREVFLRHELQHAFKRDNLWLFIQKCIRDFFWFHPMVYWLDRQISWEREMMRDEDVLKETQNNTTYLNCLMKASKVELPRSCATSLALNGSPFARRIKAIAYYKPNALARIASAFASVITIALLLAVFVVSENTVQAQDNAPTRKSTVAEINEKLEQSILNAKEKLEEDEKTKTEPKLSESEQAFVKEFTALAKENKEAAEKKLFAELNEDSPAAYYFIAGSLLGEKNETKEALDMFHVAVEKFPNFLRAARNAGILEVQLGNFDEGKKMLLRAYSLMEKPDNTTCGLIGLCYVILEEYATAEYYYRQATELNPDVRDWKLGLAKALLNQSKYEEAISIMESAKIANIEENQDPS